MSGSYGSSWTRLDSTAALMSRSESSIRGHYRGGAGRVASKGLVARDGAGGAPPGDLSHRPACMGGAAGIWQVNMSIQTELPWPTPRGGGGQGRSSGLRTEVVGHR